MLDDDDEGPEDEELDDWDDWDCSDDTPRVVHVIHSREPLHWIDRVLGVRDVSTDTDDPDECS